MLPLQRTIILKQMECNLKVVVFIKGIAIAFLNCLLRLFDSFQHSSVGVETEHCRGFDSYLETWYYTSPNVLLATRVLNLTIHLWLTIKGNNAHVWIGQGCQVLEIEWREKKQLRQWIMFQRQWFNSQCKLRTQAMENNSISNKNHKYAVWLRCSLLWKEKAISIFPDLEKKNVSGKLCTYIKDFMRLATCREALVWRQNHS